VQILILGADTFVGRAIEAFIDLRGRHTVEALPLPACRWKRERHAKKDMRRSQAALVIDTRILAATWGLVRLHESDVERTGWVANACDRSGKALLYLSSARVFNGDSGAVYDEERMPDNPGGLGTILRRCEALAREQCGRTLVLRTGPVYAAQGSNPLTWILERLLRGEPVAVDALARICPVPADDLARVVGGIVDQIGTGLEPWGVYHYCSVDSTTCFEFAEAVLASAVQFAAIEAGVEEAAPAQTRGAGWSLDCGRIRSIFGVRQIEWRPCVSACVRDFFERRAG